MRIVIIGAGQVGSFLARELSNDHDVVVIENNKERFDKIRDSLDVLSIYGEGDNPEILKKAGLDESQVLLAVSGDDRTNILSTLYANNLNLNNIICRIRNSTYAEYPGLLNNENISLIAVPAMIFFAASMS